MIEQFKNQTRDERISFLKNALDSIIHERSCIDDEAAELGLMGAGNQERLKELRKEWDAMYNEYTCLRDAVISEVVN